MVETITDDALEALKILSGGIASIMVNTYIVQQSHRRANSNQGCPCWVLAASAVLLVLPASSCLLDATSIVAGGKPDIPAAG